MKIPIITSILKRQGRQRLRRKMRGYKFLKASNKLARITIAKVALTNTRIGQCERCASKLIFGAGIKDVELIIRQYLLVRVGGYGLNKALLKYLGKPGALVVHPLPSEWREVLRQHGFEVDEFRSAIAWNVFVSLMFFYGIFSVVRQFFGCIKEIIRPSFQPLGRFAYFDSLIVGNLPQPCQDGRSHDVVSWYQQWTGRVRELDTLCHSVKGVSSSAVEGVPVVSVPSAILPLTQLRKLIRMVGWAIAASGLALIDLFRNRWWHAFILGEASKAAMLRLQNRDRLAQIYLLPNTNHIYRPLWTYEAEKLGSQITFYFFSTNAEHFKRSGSSIPIPFGYQAMNWPHYLVWDEYQSHFVKKVVGASANIDVVGPIWFYTSSVEAQDLPLNTVAVFDVQPFRDSQYQTYCLDIEYYTPKTANKFLSDNYKVIMECGGTLAFKRKRKFVDSLHPSYLHFLKKFDGLPNVISVNPDMAALRLIESCTAVISMPFTSTANMGKHLGKPSVYYDPNGLVQKNDTAAHGIEILQGPEQLSEWLAEVMKQGTFK